MVRGVTNGAVIDGKSIVVANEGVIDMNELIFINSPGSNNITFSLNSDSVNLDIAKAIYGDSYRLPVFVVNFRYCRPGEYISRDKWLSWSENSYSLN